MATQVISRSAIIAVPVEDKGTANVASKVRGLSSAIVGVLDSFSWVLVPHSPRSSNRMSETDKAIVETTLSGFRHY